MSTEQRLPYLKPGQMDEARRDFYDDVIANLDRPGLPHVTKLSEGQMVGPFTAMFNFPEYGEPLYRLQLRIIKQKQIPKDICELAILTVACAEGAAYAIYAHELLALKEGVPAEAINAIKAGKTPVLDCPQAKAAYTFAEALTRRGPVPQPVYDEAFVRFGAEGVATLVNTAALFKYLSTLMNAYDEPIPKAED
jgi:4-carboxymuconolactone decarboxylase